MNITPIIPPASLNFPKNLGNVVEAATVKSEIIGRAEEFGISIFVRKFPMKHRVELVKSAREMFPRLAKPSPSSLMSFVASDDGVTSLVFLNLLDERNKKLKYNATTILSAAIELEIEDPLILRVSDTEMKLIAPPMCLAARALAIFQLSPPRLFREHILNVAMVLITVLKVPKANAGKSCCVDLKMRRRSEE